MTTKKKPTTAKTRTTMLIRCLHRIAKGLKVGNNNDQKIFVVDNEILYNNDKGKNSSSTIT